MNRYKNYLFKSVRVYVCVSMCMRGREFLMQGFVSHSLGVVNNVVLKTCEVLPSGMIQSHRTYLHKTLPDLTLLVGCFRIFDIARHFHFSLFGISSQLPWLAVL